ncbi:hypothetical protein ACR3S7_000243 [Campylobacter lari]|uniref:hypothetical protein n=1 Tax=Campylobacter sp. CNRCH_2013_0898h TaxID=2911601 RepID=UPI001406CCCB|nr:hypothetical protein [Campylobacter sp. CNRCH_2013_0898h]EAI4447993.1 hypothetical protein [Campylobacter lari]EAI4449043.1 hypothetical protein [Campylobacter lari]EAK5534833.1 hypothetical protein [Campylobacter lari]EFB0441581.1 hypothetical protein [Campylobacter lari]EGK8127381.1 hypothetical protein [Campylobacter lari]
MKNLLVFALAIVFAICGAYFYTNSSNTGKKRELITTLTPLTCDLNIQECKYNFKDKKVLVNLNPKPITTLNELDLNITNLGEFKKLNARVYGLNMYMGDIVPQFKKINNTYHAKLVLSSCTLDIMRFRIELFDDETPLGFYFDFDVKR